MAGKILLQNEDDSVKFEERCLTWTGDAHEVGTTQVQCMKCTETISLPKGTVSQVMEIFRAEFGVN